MSRAYQRQLSALAGQEDPRPITLPRFDIPDIIDTEQDVKENARRFLERRTIKQGLDAWTDIGRANSFESWKKIGQALLVGKHRALAITMANGPWGQNYCREFNRWAIEHHFDKMPAPTRSVAIELAENAEAITIWRNGLSEKQRRRLVHPLSVTRRWRAATTPSDPTDFKPRCTGKSETVSDLARDAWRRFVSCVEALPPDQAAPLWQTVLSKVKARHSAINGP
jgi:hypothetical protein